MMRLTTGTTAMLTLGRLTTTGRRGAWVALAIAALAAVMPGSADAQFGMPKKLKSAKDAMSAPDSAARAKDSLARIQQISNGEVFAAKKLGVDPTSIVNNAVSKAAASAQQKASQAATGTTPDAQIMIEFQQSMMTLSMEATAGSASARSKLDAWRKMSEKFEAEATKLNPSIAAGDMTAYVTLQALQTKLMRDWLTKYGDAPMKAAPRATP